MAQPCHHCTQQQFDLKNWNDIFRIGKKFKAKKLGKLIYNDDQVIIGLLKVSYLHQALAGIVVA